LEIRVALAWFAGGTLLKAYRKYFIAGLVIVALVIGSATAWRYLNDADLMTPSPLDEIALGNPDAPITIIEYSSSTCPHCARFHQTTFPELRARYIDGGLVRYIFREYPLNSFDLLALMLSRCAGNDRALSFVDRLYNEHDKWNIWVVDSPLSALAEIARPFGFDDERLITCGLDRKIQEGVLWSRAHGTKFGVQGTPTFFINGAKHTGYMSIEQMEEIIRKQLKKSTPP
jgi:protein-disulfide isomerase